jgi:hypothetical protein
MNIPSSQHMGLIYLHAPYFATNISNGEIFIAELLTNTHVYDNISKVSGNDYNSLAPGIERFTDTEPFLIIIHKS